MRSAALAVLLAGAVALGATACTSVPGDVVDDVATLTSNVRTLNAGYRRALEGRPIPKADAERDYELTVEQDGLADEVDRWMERHRGR